MGATIRPSLRDLTRKNDPFPALKRRAIFTLSLRDKFCCAKFIPLPMNRPAVVGRAVLCAPPPANGRVLARHDGAHGVTRPTVGLRNRRRFLAPMCTQFWKSKLSMSWSAELRFGALKKTEFETSRIGVRRSNDGSIFVLPKSLGASQGVFYRAIGKRRASRFMSADTQGRQVIVAAHRQINAHAIPGIHKLRRAAVAETSPRSARRWQTRVFSLSNRRSTRRKNRPTTAPGATLRSCQFTVSTPPKQVRVFNQRRNFPSPPAG